MKKVKNEGVIPVNENETNERVIREAESAANDAFFISEWQDDKTNAFNKFFDRHYRPLCNYSYRIVEDKYLSEDIVSASFDKIWRRRNHFDNLNNLLAYLYTITKNASLDQVAILKRLRTAHRQIAYLSDDHEDVIQNKMNRKEVLRSILAETETLPPKLKEVFGLIYLGGLSVPDAAARLSVSLNTVKTQQSLALKKLRPALLRKYSGPTSVVTQSGKYEEPAFEYRIRGIIREANNAERREMVISKKGLLISEGFIFNQRILLISELSY